MADRLVASGVPVHSLDARRPSDAPRSIFQLSRLIARLRPALVHTFLFHANIIGRLSASLAGSAPVISSIRVAERRYRHHLILENATCRLSDKLVCVSEAVSEYTRRHSHVPSTLLETIPNAIDAGSIVTCKAERSQLGVPPDGIVALYVGRLDAQKGVDVLLRALAIAHSRDPRVHVVVVGAGPDRVDLASLAQQLGVAARTHFLGWRADVPALMNAADLFVMPSRWEGMPNAVLEAMSHGLPVIATRAEGSTELVRDGETGLLVDIDRADELARALLLLAHDVDLRQRMGRGGREVTRREFSLALMIRRYTRLYESVLQETSERNRA
jgi:glycosyltransferase involved in cell wall biosynthesis